ncbi:MAG TPA: hypothetical protein VN083_01530 [Vicinamibacteria bacterium]|nr:hypothetical protein [Vicinamibacteria bacterium]
MSERKAFLIRIEPRVFAALQRWASDDLRSLNGQIEFILRGALESKGRLKGAPPAPAKKDDA